MPDLTENQSEKAALREAALARRDAIPPAERAAAAETIAARTFLHKVPSDLIVSGFMPMRSEISPLPLLRRFAEAGHPLALPAIAGRGRPLIMRAYAFGDELARGQWDIREPTRDKPELEPDILIVPLAAFDRAGHRIGHGAGYYDMTIAALRAKKSVTTIGVAFAVQEIARVPATERDQRLDFVLTENGLITTGGE